MTISDKIKPVLLSLAIMAGLFAQAKSSHAMELEVITVAGGCFWCVEADFEKVDGVKEAVSGFTGGTIKNPTYKQVTSGKSGHLEAVQITFDSTRVSAAQLYHLFFRSIDPTDAGGQFCDRGKSYSTAIFAVGDHRVLAEKAKAEAEKALGQPIVTPILGAGAFYPADEYHQNFYKKKDIIITRFGPTSKAKAYKRYRAACNRDQTVRDIWGDAAPFAGS